MVPGITDTECRIAELRSRDLLANAERQRIAAQAPRTGSDCLRCTAVVSGRLDILVRRISQRLHGIRMLETTDTIARPQLLSVSK